MTHTVTCGKDLADVELHEVHCFVGAGLFVTVHADPIPAVDRLADKACGEVLARGAFFALYALTDALVDANIPTVERLGEAIEEIEERVLERPAREDLTRLFALRRALVQVARVISPQRDVFATLSRRGDPLGGEREALHMRDVHDHVVRTIEQITMYREILGGAVEAWLSAVSNRTNEIMKRLTLVSTVFLPLTFISGFFGMNFESLPFKNTLLLDAVIGVTVLLPIVMFVFFNRRRWL